MLPSLDTRHTLWRSARGTRLAGFILAMAFVARVSWAGAWAIINRRVARRLRVNPIANAVVAPGRRNGSLRFDDDSGAARPKDLRVLSHGINIGRDVLQKSWRGRHDRAGGRIERKTGADSDFDRTAIVRQVVGD